MPRSPTATAATRPSGRSAVRDRQHLPLASPVFLDLELRVEVPVGVFVVASHELASCDRRPGRNLMVTSSLPLVFWRARTIRCWSSRGGPEQSPVVISSPWPVHSEGRTMADRLGEALELDGIAEAEIRSSFAMESSMAR
jgi:hypothetical protein